MQQNPHQKPSRWGIPFNLLTEEAMYREGAIEVEMFKERKCQIDSEKIKNLNNKFEKVRRIISTTENKEFSFQEVYVSSYCYFTLREDTSKKSFLWIPLQSVLMNFPSIGFSCFVLSQRVIL